MEQQTQQAPQQAPQQEAQQEAQRLTAEEQQFIGSFESEFEPESQLPSEPTPPPTINIEEAELIISAGLVTIESGLQSFLHERFKFDPASVEKTAKAVAPVVVKYGDNIPDWISGYFPEMLAFVAVGGLCFGSYRQLQMLNAEDLRNAQGASAVQHDLESANAAN